MVNLRGMWASCPFLQETKIYDKMVLEGNLNVCMHLLNGIISPQYHREVHIGINYIEDTMRSHFECLALVKCIHFSYKFLLFYSLSLLIFSFIFFHRGNGWAACR